MKSQDHLDYLEGIRAITASYVVLFHALVGFVPKPASTLGRTLFRICAFGHEAVAIFIVLSGFCLTLAAAKAPSPEAAPSLTLDLPRFALRRARRILPPYFFALAISLGLIALFPQLRRADTGTIWDDSSPAFSMGAIASHLLLSHNWFPDLKFTINGPLWSVATEWQIYFLFALVLLPWRRRLGPALTLVFGFLLGYLPLLVSPARSASAVTWYVPLFCFGMLACLGTLKGHTPERHALSRIPLRWVAFCSTLGVAIAGLVFGQYWFRSQPLGDLAVGVASALVLASLAQEASQGRRSTLRRFLEQRALVRVGRMSYSLYLIHLPVVALISLSMNCSTFWGYLAEVAIACGASLAFGALFFWSVERRFLSR